MVTWSRPSVGGVKMSPGGTTKGRGRSSRSRKPSVPVQTNEQRNLIFEKYRAGSISQAQAIGQIQGATAQASFQAKLLAQQQQAQAVAKAKLDKVLADQEFKKILAARARIIARGHPNEKTHISTAANSGANQNTGDKLKVSIWQDKGNKIIRTENLTQGIVTYNRYASGVGGGSVRFQGGVTKGATPTNVKKPVTFEFPNDITKPIKITLSPETIRLIKNNDLSSALGNIQSTRQLNATIQNNIKLGKVSSFLVSVADIISGGAITEKKINNDQAKLNNRIIKFNDKYNGKELSETEFNKAQSEQKYIESEQKKLDNRIDGLVSSKANTVRNLYQSLSVQKTPRLTVKQQADVIKARNENVRLQNHIKQIQPIIDKKNKQIKQKVSEISKLQNKSNRNILDEIKLFRLKNQINTLETEIAMARGELPPKILAGTMPIIPAAAIPSGISQVRFVGTQKVGEGGKIVTDLVFKTRKGIMGVARGVSTTVKGNTVSMVAGRFGKVTAKLLKGGRKFTKIRTFFGTEKSIVKSVKFTSDKLKQIAKFIQNKKKTGLLRVIKTNIKGMQQSGIGRVATIRGRTFFKPFIRFPSGRLGAKLGKGIDLDDFASVSAILTKGDLSAILGKTITMKGRKAEFIGLIKSLFSGSSRVALTSINKQQYSKALQKLFTTVAAAVSKAERSGRFATKSLVLAGAAASLSRNIPTASSMISAKTTLVQKKIMPSKQSLTTIQRKIISKKARSLSLVQKRKTITKQKQIQRQINKQKSKIKQISKGKSKSKQKQINRAKQQQKLLQKQLQKTKLKQKLVQKQLLRSPVTPKIAVPMIPVRMPFIFSFKLSKGFKRRSLSKAKRVFYVKIKQRGKIVNLTPRPLVLQDAKNFLAFLLDNTKSRSAWMEPMGVSKKIVTIPSKMKGYFSKNSRKFRSYKIKVGRKQGIRLGYIESRKYFKDKPGERVKKKKQVRRVTPKRKTTIKKKRVKRKITSQQRKILIKRLIKARAAKRRK